MWFLIKFLLWRVPCSTCIILHLFKPVMKWIVKGSIIDNVSEIKMRSCKEFVDSNSGLDNIFYSLHKSPIALISLFSMLFKWSCKSTLMSNDIQKSFSGVTCLTTDLLEYNDRWFCFCVLHEKTSSWVVFIGSIVVEAHFLTVQSFLIICK